MEAERARELLRNALLLGGEIRLMPEGSALFAEFSLQAPVTLVAAMALMLEIMDLGQLVAGAGFARS